MSNFEQADIGRQFEAIAMAEEWSEVSAKFDEMLPKALDDFSGGIKLGRYNPAIRNGIEATAGLKAALQATYFTGLTRENERAKPHLHIESSYEPGFGPNFMVRLERDLSPWGTMPIELKGNAVAYKVIQPLGAMIGSKVLEMPAYLWQFNVRSGGDSNPHIRATFTPQLSGAPTLSLAAQYMHPGNLELQVDGKYEVIERADPEIVKAALGLANALTHWITKPEAAQRGRYAANERAVQS